MAFKIVTPSFESIGKAAKPKGGSRKPTMAESTSFDFGFNSHAISGRADGGDSSPPVSEGEKRKKRKRARPGRGNPAWSGKRAAGFRQAMFGSN